MTYCFQFLWTKNNYYSCLWLIKSENIEHRLKEENEFVKNLKRKSWNAQRAYCGRPFMFVYPWDCQEQIIFQAESVFLEGRRAWPGHQCFVI